MNFEAFPKIPRLNRGCVITEKIDGTNAQVLLWDELHVDKSVGVPAGPPPPDVPWLADLGEGLHIAAGSRNRWITLKDDNYGFARWVFEHRDQLVYLKHGRHFGEWWGKGIQRGYGIAEKRFSLFNVARWVDSHLPEPEARVAALSNEYPNRAVAPGCCHVVPELHRGPFSTHVVDHNVSLLGLFGSVAAPGFKKPEGVIVFHEAANHCFKVTLENDEVPKNAR